ncbi:MAG TPA: L,D-transpeptidase [Verrucomicrobiota bacterium]|nr:L,D-transpeptidase [Verrucomicrobiota bacterium]
MTSPDHNTTHLPCRQLIRRWLLACRQLQILPTRHVLLISVRRQRMWWLRKLNTASSRPTYRLVRDFTVSTSKFGTGQAEASNRTPLGLHRIAAKIGAGWPVGTAFVERQPIGFVWQGQPSASIAHRILWLEGLEPGFNSGAGCDSRQRFIYIHGVADETKLGQPNSHGCIHMLASDLLRLFDYIEAASMVWIDAN